MAYSFDVQSNMSLGQKFQQVSWGLVFLITAVACVGFTALYSAAGGSFEPWASKQMMRFCVGLVGMFIIAMIDVRHWHRFAYAIYGVGLIMLIVVEVMGKIGMGAQRWIDLGFIQLQPSELMKIAVVMALARYFHAATLEDVRRIMFLIPPAIMILAPVGLVMVQPDLGTGGMILMAGTAMVFLAGAPLWIFIGGIAGGIALMPVAWMLMHEYQRNRVRTFLDPEHDPMGAGYHIIQSKIALGSAGIEGKGFLKGTQAHLNFLPEKQTDFIFTLWAEEWGLLGGWFLLSLMALIFIYCGWISLRCRHGFGRLLAFGLMVNFSLYVLINVSMVMGLVPVVGIPLPLISYGGTAMLSLLAGFGLIMSCNIHRDSKLPRM
ncbi:MAG: rod shape-determining protein RodA [Micavibrio sp.]